MAAATHRLRLACAVGAWLLAGMAPAASPEPSSEAGPPALTAEAMARQLGRGVNLGNILDAPAEGAWGLSLSARLFDLAKEAGFDTIRLPVRFSNHAAPVAPYAIDERFFERVDFAVAQALAHGLRIVIDMQHHRQLDGDRLDAGEFAVADGVLNERFVAIWDQIATRYRDRPVDRVLFEPYNEPHGRLDGAAWNDLLGRAITVIRKTNPDRFIVVGTTRWDSADTLAELRLPPDDRRLIATVHDYEPFHFTHQGASWVTGSGAWLGTRCCDAAQREAIARPLDVAARWSRAQDRPVFVGEFGADVKADETSRAAYTRFARDAIESRGFSWAYWELTAADFGLWDPDAGRWRPLLREALTGPP